MITTTFEGLRLPIPVYHVIPNLHVSSGGPSFSVAALATANSGVPHLKVSLVTQRRNGEASSPMPHFRGSHIIADASGRVSEFFALRLRAELQKLDIPPAKSVIHCHGLWLPANVWSAEIAKKRRARLVIQPHGMLASAALQHHAARKRIAMKLYQRRVLDRADVVIATSEAEYQDIRAAGLRQPIAIIPHGIDFACRDESIIKSTPPTVLFVGRIHPIKGLMNLLDAWAAARPAGWRLVLAGPDQDGFSLEVLSRAAALGLSEVSYVGPLAGTEKSRAYAEAELLVLPSLTENFGMVIGEALSQGLPVITTTGTPWSDINTYKCGWWVDPNPQKLAQAISEATSLSSIDRTRMGENGRSYARQFGWETVAQNAASVYSWIVGGGPRPRCVQLS